MNYKHKIGIFANLLWFWHLLNRAAWPCFQKIVDKLKSAHSIAHSQLQIESKQMPYLQRRKRGDIFPHFFVMDILDNMSIG